MREAPALEGTARGGRVGWTVVIKDGPDGRRYVWLRATDRLTTKSRTIGGFAVLPDPAARRMIETWAGTCDDWPEFLMLYLSPDIVRVMIALRGGGEHEIQISPVLPAFSARVSAAELQVGYAETLRVIADDDSSMRVPLPLGYGRRA